MSVVRFLFDEHLERALVSGVLRAEPSIDIIRVGEPAGPPLATKNSALLLAAETSGRLLLTRDRRTMPRYLAEHLAAGRHTWGVFIVRPAFTRAQIVNELLLIWSASQAEEWRDRLEYIPWAIEP